MRQCSLFGCFLYSSSAFRARLREVRGIHAARKTIDSRMPLLLGAIQASPSGKHHIGAFQQRGLALQQLRRRIQKSRELVHAIVHCRARIQPVGERQGHRCIEPQNVIAQLFPLHQRAE